MKQIARLSGVLAATFLLMVVAAVTAGAETVNTRLTGYQDAGDHQFNGKRRVRGKINKDGTAIDYKLT